ncbi:glycosyltransferase [Horticoccus luteus]|uniref:Glycosyltransferase n=1 Tax=Horticoccus luteus TaxID=2862869 RepID=A0A8F9TYG9_9BACT|nr:glycosyltransferase family 2 protein [Horticoccus luteus]QYM79847.1 glycosyltransferase [Horticoccus luteus]
MQPNLSIIVPHKNDPVRLESCLAGLSAQVESGDEIIVVDNGSGDHARAAAEGACWRMGARFFSCDRGGSYAARNVGIEQAKNDVFVFTDADCRPAAEFLPSYRAWFATKRAPAIAAGPVALVPRRGGRFNAWECIDRVYGFPQAEMVQRSGTAMTANLAVSRAAVEQWGAFDARLFSGGDVEFSRRVSSRVPGGMGWVPGATILHPTRATRGEHLRRMMRTHEGLERLARQAGAVGATKGTVWRAAIGRPSARWKQILHLADASLPAKAWALVCLADLRLARMRYKARLRRELDLGRLAREVN